MIGAGVPCPGDPLVTCGTGGGSWWPLIVGAIVAAWWLGFRFGRYGGWRCPICLARPGQTCAAGCYNDWPTDRGTE